MLGLTKKKEDDKPNGELVKGALYDKLKRGRDRMREDAPKRNECLRFWRGDTYVYVNGENYLVKQSTVTNGDGSGKLPHRVRQSRNLIMPVVGRKVSAAVQRTPGYSITPATTDPEDTAAAKLGDMVALAGYDQWSIRDRTKDVVTLALVADEGFAWPYWDTSIGPYVQQEDGSSVGVGDVCIRTFGPNEVFWEPGLSFHVSRWHAVEQARSAESVESLPDYLGGKLKPDANASDLHESKYKGDGQGLVMVTEYLERPSAQNPKGRWVVIANDRIICKPRDYPCLDGEGEVLDEPVLHKLAFITDPDSDRDMGLVRHLLDAERTYQDCTNKQVEWKNLCLMPQFITTPNNLRTKRTDAPGAVNIVNSLAADQFKVLDPPQVPGDLQAIKEEAKQDIAFMAADNEIPNQVESGKGIDRIFASNQEVWADFYASKAQFDARLMRHCLYLVQRNYTGEKLMRYRGRLGWESVPDFQGSDIRGQTDVRVNTDSVVPRTREQIEQQVMNIAQMFPGWLTPEKAIKAVQTGQAETLIDSYYDDQARAHRIIQKVKDGSVLDMPQRFEPQMMDPETGMQGMYVPGWMPRRFDNLAVQRAEWEDWLKSTDAEEAPPELQEVANLVYDGFRWLEAQAEQEALMAQTAQAEGQGAMNAAKTPAPKPMPSLPGAAGPSSN